MNVLKRSKAKTNKPLHEASRTGRHSFRTHFLIVLFLFCFNLSFASAQTKQYPTGYAKTDVNFRSSPDGNIITGISGGEFFEVLNANETWSKVRLADSRVGYIYSKYISMRSPDAAETEASVRCLPCELKKAGGTQDAVEGLLNTVQRAGGPAQCLTNKLLFAAHKVLKNKYHNRKRGKGKCQVAVRLSLTAAGIWTGGGFGHAKDTIPGMKTMGFLNIKTPGMTPNSAPNGSILVYGRALRGAKHCRGLGTTYGHIEIKENNHSYIYDGNPSDNIQHYYGSSCRPLIGVMQMGPKCLSCTKKAKQACGV